MRRRERVGIGQDEHRGLRRRLSGLGDAGGIFRVERQIRRTCLQYPQERDSPVQDRGVKETPIKVFGAGAAGDQMPGNTVGGLRPVRDRSVCRPQVHRGCGAD